MDAELKSRRLFATLWIAMICVTLIACFYLAN